MRGDTIRNEEIRRRAGIGEILAGDVNRRVSRWFGQVEMIDEGSLPRKVKADKVEGRQGRGRPRFGWLDRVKSSSALEGVCLQEASQLAKERSVWRELVRA